MSCDVVLAQAILEIVFFPVKFYKVLFQVILLQSIVEYFFLAQSIYLVDLVA